MHIATLTSLTTAANLLLILSSSRSTPDFQPALLLTGVLGIYGNDGRLRK